MNNQQNQAQEQTKRIDFPQKYDINTSNLNDYILQDNIGSGGFGKVYRVKNKENNKIYAAKISKNAINENTKDLFQDISSEVNIISKLNHPLILKFIKYSPFNFKRKPKPVIIMEYASRGSLEQLIEHDISNPDHPIMTDTLKLKIIYGVAHAMSYLHEHYILHRDLKPDNILLDEFLNPKVADFGLSKTGIQNEFFLKTSVEKVMGTSSFIAPEIWYDYQYSEASDVYAFSIVVFEIMTCSHAFSNVNIYKMMLNVSNGKRPTFDVFVPDVYKWLIRRCWSQKPADRPSFAEIVSMLRNDRSFITESVNEKEFIDYVKFIDGYKATFNEERVIIPTNSAGQIEQFPYVSEKLFRMFEDSDEKSIHIPYECEKCLNEKSLLVVDKAELGNIELQFEVGRNLIEGRLDFPFDVRNGLKFLKSSMKGGNKEAASYYVNMLIKGEIIPQDFEEARKIIDEHLSESESIRLHYIGKVLKKEGRYTEAANFFLKSIELNNVDSMYEYAKLLLKNSIKNDSQIESIAMFKKAISLGHFGAMYKLGVHYYESNEKSKQEEGISLIKKAADEGNVKAMYTYGTIVEKEDDDEDSESMKYFKQAADLGDGKSMNKYGVKLLKHICRQSKRESKLEAVSYMKKASKRGFAESMHEYGMLLVSGDIGIPPNAKKGSKYVKCAALIGNADAIGKYAILLRDGNGVENDTEEAIKYFKEGIEKGSSIAMTSYAFMLQNGLGVNKDYKEAIKYYKMAVDKGNSNAMSNYAFMLKNGQGVSIDYNEAIKYYKMAIEKGNSNAMNNFAIMLQYGQGVTVDIKEAIKYYKMAIDKGNSGAINNYALMLQNGQGVDINIKEAIKYYKMAIDKGNSGAINNYALMLQNGQGVDINIKEAIKYFKMAINRGNSDSMTNYALILQYGQGVSVDIKEAIKYYKMAIDKGNEYSTFYYADILRKGEGVPIDIEESIKYYKLGIERGNPYAMYKYATMLEKGEGIEADVDEANKYYKMALENYKKGHFKNQTCIMAGHAMMLYEGKGVEKNEEEAIKILKTAVAYEDEEAMMIYGQILVDKKETEEMMNEGLKLIRESAEKGFSEALYEYGHILEEGKIIEQNIEESIKYYKKASERGNRKAQEALQRIIDARTNSNV